MEKKSEERIAEIKKRKESIANRKYNEGYLSTFSEKNEEKYNEVFSMAKIYSINLGKRLEIINSYLFYDEINNYEF